MKPGIRAGMVRHPLFPNLTPVYAAESSGSSEAIVGTYAELLSASARGASASHSIFPVQTSIHSALTDFERDTLWELFEVPAYVVVVNGEGRVLAFECEAQEGLHLLETFTVTETLETSACECGRTEPRLIPSHSEITFAPHQRAG